MPAAIDLTGRTFNYLTVLKLAARGGRSAGRRQWLCSCACGVTTIVATADLRSGNTSSCGCFRKQYVSEKSTRHGMRYTREYRTWSTMVTRCCNPNTRPFKNYGGRGIAVCERWLDFINFYDDMGNQPKGLELDRIDNDGNYEPGNCRWVTCSQNIKNGRARIKNAKGQFTGGISSKTWEQQAQNRT